MQRRKIVAVIVATAFVAAAILWFWLLPVGHGPTVAVTVLDVGQGDAILIRTPGGNDVLIDGGPDGRVVDALARHLPPSDRTIELVVLTHPDYDHVGGLPAVAQRYRIDRVLETAVRSSSRADQEWERSITEQGSERLHPAAGVRVNVDQVSFDILWPQTDADLRTKQRNDTSVILRMTYGSTTMLFAGDASSTVEDRLVQSGTLSEVDALKVPHHGSITSSSDAFLDAVKPEIAVISVGAHNRYGHPHPVVLRRLERRNVRVLRTDERGDVTLVSDGKLLQTKIP